MTQERVNVDLERRRRLDSTLYTTGGQSQPGMTTVNYKT